MLLLLLACGTKDSPDTATDGPDQDEARVEGPCDGEWEPIQPWIEDPDAALHVAPSGTPSGTGRPDDPFDSLANALTWARDNQPGAEIVLWPGSYPDTAVVLFEAEQQGVDDSGTRIVGCGPSTTTLMGSVDAPTLDVQGVVDVVLAGFTIQGGYRGLQIQGGAHVETASVEVEAATRVGAFVDGPATEALLRDLAVRNTALDEGEYGWGIAIQDAKVTLQDPVVEQVTGVGLLVHFGSAQVVGGQIRSVSPDGDGLFGRGVQLQALSSGSLEGLEVREVQDAGVFAHRTVSLDVNDIWVVDTGAGLTAEGGTPTGDGLVVTQAAGNFDPGDFNVQVNDSVFENSARAGVVLDGVTAELNEVSTPGAALVEGELSVFGQNDAKVGGESVEPGGGPLELNLGTLHQ